MGVAVTMEEVAIFVVAWTFMDVALFTVAVVTKASVALACARAVGVVENRTIITYTKIEVRM